MLALSQAQWVPAIGRRKRMKGNGGWEREIQGKRIKKKKKKRQRAERVVKPILTTHLPFKLAISVVNYLSSNKSIQLIGGELPLVLIVLSKDAGA